MPDKKRDYYETLGVAKDANDDDIKRAFRTLAKKYHPDLHPDDKTAEEKFKELQEAYSVVSDPEKRQRYDQLGFAGVEGTVDISGNGFNFSDLFGGIGDIFGSFFGGGRNRGGGRQQPRQQVGEDVEKEVHVTLEDTVFGTKREVKFKRAIPCSHCNGIGAEPGSDVKKCPQCKGQGQVRQGRQTVFGTQVYITTCPQCRGEGKTFDKPCTACKGRKIEFEERTVNINIEPGIEHGTILKAPGAGHIPAPGAMPGDLLVGILVEPHSIFGREGNDLYCMLEIDFVTTIFGGEVDCPVIRGGIKKLRIPPGTQFATELRVRDEGVPYLRSSQKGDMYVKLKILLPRGKDLTKDQTVLLKRFQDLYHGKK
ncbi:MAG: chaperone protein DnaJ [Promethearchaeota archaeon CR_4]|nr:MAG: chaperone protein DnaJ [Candidatus Lokiarchaeota archaeon CR_4]